MAYHLKHNPEKWTANTRVLCIDQGTKTLGLAVCNSDQTVVTPLETIHRTKWPNDQQLLAKLIEEYEIGAIVVGYPLNMDGTKGPRCKSVQDFTSLMEQLWPAVTFFFWDERLSTATLDRSVHKSVNKDSHSAVIILDHALGWVKNTA